MAGKLSSYRVVHFATAGVLMEAGFGALPTFGRPHVTLVIRAVDQVKLLLELLGPAQANPRYGGMRRRKRG